MNEEELEIGKYIVNKNNSYDYCIILDLDKNEVMIYWPSANSNEDGYKKDLKGVINFNFIRFGTLQTYYILDKKRIFEQDMKELLK